MSASVIYQLSLVKFITVHGCTTGHAVNVQLQELALNVLDTKSYIQIASSLSLLQGTKSDSSTSLTYILA